MQRQNGWSKGCFEGECSCNATLNYLTLIQKHSFKNILNAPSGIMRCNHGNKNERSFQRDVKI